ncbi:MAG: hypothetical protein GF353_21160 [Candidatus Lokiarchaeota archaeon]|nr:hypothetical protein [Candidatus Lokiarchaeota archaeon]
MNLDYVKKPILFIIILTIFSIIHELGHAIAAILTGGECLAIGFDFTNFCYYCKIKYYTIEGYRITVAAGSATSCGLAFIVNLYSYKKKWIFLYSVSKIMLFSELMYWTISPLIGLGDGFVFFSSFEGVNPAFFSTLFLGLLTCLIVIYYKNASMIIRINILQ